MAGLENGCVLWTLPEDCVANALSLTSPKDACRLSLVASTFRAAAQSDAVWERFLPSDYRDILSRSSLETQFNSKKDLFLYLSNHPILIDAGLKSFSLEKESGKKIFMLSARDMFIVWTCTPVYWKWTTHPKSRFDEVAELLNVCWLEIRGKINLSTLSSNTNYAAYLVYKCKSIYGFDDLDVDGCVGINGHEIEKNKICLDPAGPSTRRANPSQMDGLFYKRMANILNPRGVPEEEEEEEDDGIHCPQKRRDGWYEVELGEYFVGVGEDGDFEMSCTDLVSGDWKGGIVVQGIEIRPKHKN